MIALLSSRFGESVFEAFDAGLEDLDDFAPFGFEFFVGGGKAGLRDLQNRPHMDQPLQAHLLAFQIQRRRNDRGIGDALYAARAAGPWN